ncbi:MAG: mechanosensitive ion channel domain-containing protein, partial [Usitatibacter sp.]
MAIDYSPLKKFVEGIAGDPSPRIILWQLGVVAVTLALGYYAARVISARVKPNPRWQFGAGDFEHVAYPLFALAFMFAGRIVLQQFQRVTLLEIVQTLIVAWLAIRIAVYVLGHVLPPGGFLRASIRTIAWIAWIGVALHLTGLLPEVIDALDNVGFSTGRNKVRVTLWLVMQALAALALTLTIAAWISRVTESRVLAADAMEMSTRVVITKLVRVATMFLAIMVALPMVGIDITTLSIFGGALGVGLGFGLQKIASNYVSGFIVLIDRSLRLGDLITVDGRKGKVMAIESRYTVIKAADGTESIIPNEKLITESVYHHTFTDTKAASKVAVSVAYDSNVE